MLKLFTMKKRLRAFVRKEVAREAHETMLSHAAARQSLDLYEMRLETIETRLAKRLLQVEDRVAALEAELAMAAEPRRRAG